MAWSLPSALTLHRSVQLKLNSDVNWTIKLNQKQIRASAKPNGIRWCQQCNKPDTIGATERDLPKGYKLRTNYVKNKTSISSFDLEQVTSTKYPRPISNTLREIIPTLHVSCFIKIDDNKTGTKWHKIPVSDTMTLSKRLNLTKYD